MASSLSINEATALYNSILFRAPDAAGLAFMSSALDSGAYSVAQAETVLVSSAEIQADVAPVVRLYEAAFGRLPDTAGLTYWAAQEASGASPLTMALSFTGSAEFASVHGASVNAADYIQGLYLNVLGRAADAAGLAYWVNALGATPTAVTEAAALQSFANSPEFANNIQASIATWLTNAATVAVAATTASTVG